LLVLSELGIVGVILLLAMIIVIGRELFITRKPTVIIIGALLAGMGTIALFDHYFWSLAAGRMMLGIALGLWFGQAAEDGK
jgi:predicted MFS family arabinose efflux permease